MMPKIAIFTALYFFLMTNALFAQIAEEDMTLNEIKRQEQYRKESFKGKKFTSSPMLGPDGIQLVAVIGQNRRFMTIDELKYRTEYILAQIPKEDPLFGEFDRTQREEQRMAIEESIIDEWAIIATLAVFAQDQKFTVSNQEIDDAFAQLIQQSAEQPTSSIPTINGDKQDSNRNRRSANFFTGLPEAMVRNELRDGLLVEKAVSFYIDKNFTDDDFKAIYKKAPKAFAVPDKVNVCQIFTPIDASMNKKDISAIQKNMKQWVKKLKQCKSDEEYQTLAKEISAFNKELLNEDPNAYPIRMTYLREVGPIGTSIAPDVLKTVFSLKPGNVEGPFIAAEAPSSFSSATGTNFLATGKGCYVVKVLERIEGGSNTFEFVKPRIKNYLFENVKLSIYMYIKPLYKVQINASGLRNYKEIPSSTQSKDILTAQKQPEPPKPELMALNPVDSEPLPEGSESATDEAIRNVKVLSQDNDLEMVEGILNQQRKKTIPTPQLLNDEIEDFEIEATSEPSQNAIDARAAEIYDKKPTPMPTPLRTPKPRATPLPRRQSTKKQPSFNVDPPSVEDALRRNR